LRSARDRSGSCYFDFATAHSNEEPAWVKPWPLQAFCPLQAFFALLHALWPLHAFPPAQTTAAEADAAMKVVAANTAAAVLTTSFLSIEMLPVYRDRVF
jgi:hypothetical protein